MVRRVIYSTTECQTMNSAKPHSGKTWGLSMFKEIRSHIRTHLEREQHKRCFYCRLPIIGISYPRIDHIVPKGKHPEFLFYPKNLILACEICNNKKGKKETLNNPRIQRYPAFGSAFNIIHPYFDRYSIHIKLRHNLFLVGVTDKGKTTVIFCRLNRLNLAESRAKLMKRQKLLPWKKLMMIFQQTRNPMLKQQIQDFVSTRNRRGQTIKGSSA